MKKTAILGFIASLALVLPTHAATPAFVGNPKTRTQMLSCEIVQSTWSKKVYYKGKDDKTIRSMSPVWAVCKLKEQPKTPKISVPATKTAAQIQLEQESLNMATYGNPVGPNWKPIALGNAPLVVILPPQASNISQTDSNKPMILNFKASGLVAAIGQSVTVSWETSGAIKCAVSNTLSVAPADMDQLPNGSKQIQITEDNAGLPLWLTCADANGASDQKQYTINVDKTASIPWVSAPVLSFMKRTIYEVGPYDHLFIKASWGTNDPMDVVCKNQANQIVGQAGGIQSGKAAALSTMGWDSPVSVTCAVHVKNGPRGSYDINYVKDPTPDYPFEQ